MKENNITLKQEMFCQKYIEFGDKSKAYRTAYNCPKMKPETVWKRAHELFGNGKVSGRVKELQIEYQKKQDISTARVLREEKSIAFSDIRQLFNGEALIPPHLLPDDVARALASIKINERRLGDGGSETTYEFKFWDKGKALERLYKHLGLFEMDNKQQTVSIEEVIDSISRINRQLGEAVKRELIRRVSG